MGNKNTSSENTTNDDSKIDQKIVTMVMIMGNIIYYQNYKNNYNDAEKSIVHIIL